MGLENLSDTYTGGGYHHWDEVAFCRPHGTYLNDVTSLNPDTTEYAVGFHLLVVTQPMRVAGYMFRGKNVSQDYWRLWLTTSNPLTGLPVGPALKGSDVTRLVQPGTGVNTRRDTALAPIIKIGATVSDIRVLSIQLPNIVYLFPGFHWVGIAHYNEMAGGEYYLGSYVHAHHRGLRDLLSVPETVELDFDPAVLTAYDFSSVDPNTLFTLPEEGDMRICNIDVALLTEEWFNG